MKSNLSFEEKYKAMLNRDASFEGVFVTAVKTTGIFCRPVCAARKPKPENVIFYDSTQEALQNGYRPCQVCKPLEKANETPKHIQDLMHELLIDPYLRISDLDLKNRNIEPSQLRRWFQKNHKMSFHSYQRLLRINSAYQRISVGDAVTTAAFDVGYNSMSGFNERYRSVFGNAPTHSKRKAVIHIARFTTPLGPMFACATSEGLCLLEFTDRKMLETEFKDLTKRLNAVILPGSNHHIVQTQKELDEYFEGKRIAFSVQVFMPGTDFQHTVWNSLRTIPYGETISYKEQAIKMNQLQKVRAVASANGCNRISIIIPCHRVIGQNGDLTGYGGGLARKKWLIDFERSNLQKDLA
ncbi:bifunctional transcriptional activator/DNA repair protein Ada [Chryseolinea sp. H1M3-3]|uniref:bifunctional transcriptional activator/DNA repair enzyme AdaA n=1 Tax=Chryseolinea sp. H1M3-3 TaxID=3034144 RepID=UPI0023EAB140|nr:bifunctional transcriptional activator/DNA repair protein Ada [Chryseolinea sp. H1M3-3]